MEKTKIKTMTVGRMIKLLQDSIKSGAIKPETEIWQSTDEEGNSYSPVTFEGTVVENLEDGKTIGLTLYPILVQEPQ